MREHRAGRQTRRSETVNHLLLTTRDSQTRLHGMMRLETTPVKGCWGHRGDPRLAHPQPTPNQTSNLTIRLWQACVKWCVTAESL